MYIHKNILQIHSQAELRANITQVYNYCLDYLYNMRLRLYIAIKVHTIHIHIKIAKSHNK